jgi:hypothetical protein
MKEGRKEGALLPFVTAGQLFRFLESGLHAWVAHNSIVPFVVPLEPRIGIISSGESKRFASVSLQQIVAAGLPKKKMGESFSLAVITLTACVVYMAVFEYHNQVIFSMNTFDGGPSLSY